MRFLMLIKANRDTEAGVMPNEKTLAAMAKYNEELVKAGVLLERAQASFEEAALGVVGDQPDRRRVTLRRRRRASQPAEQLGARGMEQVIAVEVAGGGEGVDEVERRAGALDHRDRRRAVEGDDGRGLQTLEHVVQADDLGPVGVLRPRRLAVQRGDRRLQRE